MFMGGYNRVSGHREARLIHPVPKFREQLGEEFIVTKGLDGCLFVFPQDEVAGSSRRSCVTLPLPQKGARQFARFLCRRRHCPANWTSRGEFFLPAAAEGVCPVWTRTLCWPGKHEPDRDLEQRRNGQRTMPAAIWMISPNR